MKTTCLVAAFLALGAVACGEKAPPPSPPKPKVEAVKPAELPKTSEAPKPAETAPAQSAAAPAAAPAATPGADAAKKGEEAKISEPPKK